MDEDARDDDEILRELGEALRELPPAERAARQAQELYRRWLRAGGAGPADRPRGGDGRP